MISSIRLQNFKAHRDTTVPLGRFTMLVGPNGAGKTSVLEALRGLGALANNEASGSLVLARNQGLADVHRRGAEEDLSMKVEGDTRGARWTFLVQLAPDEARRYYSQVVEWTHGEASGKEADIGRGELLKTPMAGAFGRAVQYRFDAEKIAAPSYPDNDVPPVAPDGSNTAAVLAGLKLADDGRFTQIESLLHTIVPSVERIRIRRMRAQQNTILEKIHLDFRGAPDVPAQSASEGTLMTLALLTAVCSAKGPRLLLLDDLDNSLHPTAQVELVRQIKRLLEELPETQIVATTHSPYILDNLDAKDVHVFALRQDGTVATKRLSEHPDVPRMIGALSPGQIWTLDPEKAWVVGEGD